MLQLQNNNNNLIKNNKLYFRTNKNKKRNFIFSFKTDNLVYEINISIMFV